MSNPGPSDVYYLTTKLYYDLPENFSLFPYQNKSIEILGGSLEQNSEAVRRYFSHPMYKGGLESLDHIVGGRGLMLRYTYNWRRRFWTLESDASEDVARTLLENGIWAIVRAYELVTPRDLDQFGRRRTHRSQQVFWGVPARLARTSYEGATRDLM